MAFRFGFFNEENQDEPLPLQQQQQQQQQQDQNSSASEITNTKVEFKTISDFCQESGAKHQQLVADHLKKIEEKRNRSKRKNKRLAQKRRKNSKKQQQHPPQENGDDAIETDADDDDDDEEDEDDDSDCASLLNFDLNHDVVRLSVDENNKHVINDNSTSLRYFSSSFLKRALQHTSLGKVDSDIIQGVYLGGLKCWSCTSDVVKTIYELSNRMKKQAPSENSPTSDWISQIAEYIFHVNTASSSVGGGLISSVADIGCGLGLCGVAAMKSKLVSSSSTSSSPSKVLFHDFNEEIATMVVSGTLSLNLLMKQDQENTTRQDEVESYQVAAGWGDWTAYYPCDNSESSSSSSCPSPLLFDLVVAADVSYDEEASTKFLEIANRLLKPGKGIALVGTKAFYFGTNGGIDSVVNGLEATNNKKNSLKLLCQSPRIGGESDMLRYVMCLIKE